MQRQDELVADGPGTGQIFCDRVEPGQVHAVDLVEDLVEQGVGAVLECVEQRLAVRVAAVERPDADPGLGRDGGERDVASFPQHRGDRRGQQALAVKLGVPAGTPASPAPGRLRGLSLVVRLSWPGHHAVPSTG